MTGDLQVGADLVVYIDHSDTRAGCTDELKEAYAAWSRSSSSWSPN